MTMKPKQAESFSAPRHSRSAAASRRAEMRRIEGMTVEDRIRAALTMSRRFAWLQPTKQSH
jgi:hypothetical protein